MKPGPHIQTANGPMLILEHFVQIRMQPDIPYLPLTPMGKKYKPIFYIIHTPHGRLFVHRGVCINIEILYKSIQSSVSCVKIVTFKGKVGPISRYFEAPDPYRSKFKVEESRATLACLYRTPGRFYMLQLPDSDWNYSYGMDMCPLIRF